MPNDEPKEVVHTSTEPRPFGLMELTTAQALSLFPTIPSDTVAAIIDHVNEGGIHGDFISACLANDLAQATAHADGSNQRCLKEIAQLLWNYAPAFSWGSKARARAWAYMRHVEREGRRSGTPLRVDALRAAYNAEYNHLMRPIAEDPWL